MQDQRLVRRIIELPVERQRLGIRLLGAEVVASSARQRAQVHERRGRWFVEFMLARRDQCLRVSAARLDRVSQRRCHQSQIVGIGGDATVVPNLSADDERFGVLCRGRSQVTLVFADRGEPSQRIHHGPAIAGDTGQPVGQCEVAPGAVKLHGPVEPGADVAQCRGHCRGVAQPTRDLKARPPVS